MIELLVVLADLSEYLQMHHYLLSTGTIIESKIEAQMRKAHLPSVVNMKETMVFQNNSESK